MPDGSRLEIVVAKVGPFPELRLSRDGEPLPGSSGDPQTRLSAATNMLFAIALLNVVLGMVVALADVTLLKAMGVGWGSVLTGAVYAGLAVLVKRRSTVALVLAVTLFILDGAYMLVATAAAKASPPVGSMIVRILFLLPMLRGFSAISELNQPRRPRRAAPRPRTADSAVGPASPAPAGSPATAAVSPPPPSPGVVKTLSGDAERLRLKMSERNAVLGPTLAGRRVDVKLPKGVDAASKSLRFIAHRCEIGEAGLRVTLPNGQVREVPFHQVFRVVARQLPPDPPWDGAVFLDVVPEGGASTDPVRIFGTTVVNYTAIPGGSTSSRIDNTRRLVAFLKERCPNATLDEATEEFVRGPKVPQRFVSMTDFIEYDTTYS